MANLGVVRHLTAEAERFRTKSGGAQAALGRDRGKVEARDYSYRRIKGKKKEEVRRWVVTSAEYPRQSRKHEGTVTVQAKPRPRKWQVASQIRASSGLPSNSWVQSSASQARVSLFPESSQASISLIHQSAYACESLSRHLHELSQSMAQAISEFESGVRR